MEILPARLVHDVEREKGVLTPKKVIKQTVKLLSELLTYLLAEHLKISRFEYAVVFQRVAGTGTSLCRDCFVQFGRRYGILRDRRHRCANDPRISAIE
jgi:hypothetical protein